MILKIIELLQDLIIHNAVIFYSVNGEKSILLGIKKSHFKIHPSWVNKNIYIS